MTSWIVAIGAGLLVGAGVAVLFQQRRARDLHEQLEAAKEDLQHLQDRCARLAPGNVVDRMVTDGIEAGAEWKEVTALFADLVGYTAMSERLEPRELAGILNGYFQRMSDAIAEHRGHVATFIGDGILAYFGAFEPNPWQCDDGVRAALAMREALARYNEELTGQGLPELAVGIGLHRGRGLAGLVGSRDRKEYAFVGRTVNVAARVQALTRTHHVDVLVTNAVREKLDPAFVLRPMPPTEVKGIAAPLETWAVESLRRRGHGERPARPGQKITGS